MNKIETKHQHIFLYPCLSVSGLTACSDLWDCGEAHQGVRVGGLRSPGLHPHLRALHLLLPRTPGIQPAAGRTDGVLQQLLKWAAAGRCEENLSDLYACTCCPLHSPIRIW